MRNDKVPICALLAGVASLMCSAKGYRTERSDERTSVVLIAERYPLVLGVNYLSLEVTDRITGRLADNEIEVRYSLPPRPGMAATSRSVIPMRNGNAYGFLVEIHTRAEWTVDIFVRRRDGTKSRLRFVLDAY